MRISLLLPGFGPLKDTVRHAEVAERSGFDGVWVAEHVGFHDAAVTAALCLDRTSQLEVGLMGLAPGSRHPALTAMEIASLDELAPGRVRVQVGTGEPELMRRIGVDPTRPVARVADFARAIRSILGGETITEHSLAGRLENFTLNRSEGGRPIAIEVLAIRPKMLTLAAQEGDGVCLTGGASRAYIRSTIAAARRARSSSALADTPFRATAVVFALVSDEWAEHVDSLANLFASFVPTIASVILRDLLSEVELEQFEKGSPEERAALFTIDVIREMAIVCKPAEVEKALENWFALGLDEVCIFPVGPEEFLGRALSTIGRAGKSLRTR